MCYRAIDAITSSVRLLKSKKKGVAAGGTDQPIAERHLKKRATVRIWNRSVA